MCTTPSIYRPRKPQQTDLYRLIEQNLDLFYEVYDERFLVQYGPLPAYVKKTFSDYLACGIHHHGFARIKCPGCGDEYLLAFSPMIIIGAPYRVAVSAAYARRAR